MARLRTLVLFVVLAALWGTSFVATRAGLPYIPPVLFAALRFDIAGTIMLAYALVSTDRWRPRAKEEWTTVALGGSLFVAAHHALLFVGQQYVTSAVAAVVPAALVILPATISSAISSSRPLMTVPVSGSSWIAMPPLVAATRLHAARTAAQ